MTLFVIWQNAPAINLPMFVKFIDNSSSIIIKIREFASSNLYFSHVIRCQRILFISHVSRILFCYKNTFSLLSSQVYIHCNLLVCESSDPESLCVNARECMTNTATSARNRRDVSNALGRDTQRFTRGPLRVVRASEVILAADNSLPMDSNKNGNYSVFQEDLISQFQAFFLPSTLLWIIPPN